MGGLHETEIELCLGAIALVSASVLRSRPASNRRGEALRPLDPGLRISVSLRDGKFLQGRLEAWSPETIETATSGSIRTLRTEEIRRIAVQQKGSRWKGALVGALIGFSVGLPIGAAYAGHLTDRNNPGFAAHAGMGAGIGMFSAGIAAPVAHLREGRRM
jgi:hypothetical protein